MQTVFSLTLLLICASVVDSTRTVLTDIRVRSALQAALLRELLMRGTPGNGPEIVYVPGSPNKRGNLARLAQMAARGFGRKR